MKPTRINTSAICKNVIISETPAADTVTNAEIQIEWLQKHAMYKRSNKELFAVDGSGIQLNKSRLQLVSKWIAQSMKAGVYSNVLQRSHHTQPPFAVESTILYADHLLIWKAYVVDESIIPFALNSGTFDLYRHHDPAVEWNIEDNNLVQIIDHAMQAQNSQYSFTTFLHRRYGLSVLEHFVWHTRNAIISKFRETIIKQVLLCPPVEVEMWMNSLRFRVLRPRRCPINFNLEREQFISTHVMQIAEHYNIHPRYILEYIQRRCRHFNGSLQCWR